MGFNSGLKGLIKFGFPRHIFTKSRFKENPSIGSRADEDGHDEAISRFWRLCQLW